MRSVHINDVTHLYDVLMTRVLQKLAVHAEQTQDTHNQMELARNAEIQ